MPEDGDRRHTDPGISTREFLLRILDERDRATQIRHDAQAEALRLASERMETRLDQLNELRAEVVKDRAAFVRRDTYDAAQEQRDQRIRALEDTTQARAELISQFRAAQADIANIESALHKLENESASQVAVNVYKRIVYAAIFTGIVALLVALFNIRA